MASNIPVIVQGNSFSLAIPLQIYYINGEQMDLEDYTPDPTDEVSVQLKGSRRNYTYTPTIDGNVANIDLSGNELADNYSVVVSIVKANGQRLRSFRTDQFFIVESSDDLTTDDIIQGLEENVIYLNTQCFVAGEDGRGITSIVKTATAGLVDTYTITYSDNTTSTFNVTNGAAGQQGADGVGITSIEKTATVGLVDTYTITLSNGQTSTFDVTNGKDGVDLGLANIVDDLTTGGSTNVLSAQQGVVLRELTEELSYGVVAENVADIPVEIIDPDIVIFNDPVAESIALENWDLNQDGKISLDEADEVTTFGTLFKGKNIITTEWMQYFQNVSAIASQGFQQCLHLVNTLIPSNIATIGSLSFNGNTACTSLVLEEGVQSIKSQAFKNNAFSTLVIPSTVTLIEWGAFDMTSLSTVTCKATTPPSSNSTVYKIFKTSGTITAIYVPAASVDAYKANQYWSPWASVIQAIPTN